MLTFGVLAAVVAVSVGIFAWRKRKDEPSGSGFFREKPPAPPERLGWKLVRATYRSEPHGTVRKDMTHAQALTAAAEWRSNPDNLPVLIERMTAEDALEQ